MPERRGARARRGVPAPKKAAAVALRIGRGGRSEQDTAGQVLRPQREEARQESVRGDGVAGGTQRLLVFLVDRLPAVPCQQRPQQPLRRSDQRAAIYSDGRKRT